METPESFNTVSAHSEVEQPRWVALRCTLRFRSSKRKHTKLQLTCCRLTPHVFHSRADAIDCKRPLPLQQPPELRSRWFQLAKHPPLPCPNRKLPVNPV